MEYSICIRTLGTAGDKYIRLIDSIKKLSIKPREVIIVIPKGYTLPVTNLDNVRVVYSEKGMLLQRIIGYEEATTEYVLMLDDDVEFNSDLVDELSKPVLEGKCSLSFPIYKELLLQGGIKSIVSAITCSSIPNKREKDKFVKIMLSGGSRYNANLENSSKYLYSESAPGMCVFGIRDRLINISLRKELWIDNVGYSLRDDAVLIYKAFLNGNKIIGVQGVNITHLDGGSNESNRNLKAAYANGYNQILFWKRFLYNSKNVSLDKTKAKIAIKYWSISTKVYLTIRFIANRDRELYKTALKGINDGFRDISKGKEELWQV